MPVLWNFTKVEGLLPISEAAIIRNKTGKRCIIIPLRVYLKTYVLMIWLCVNIGAK